MRGRVDAVEVRFADESLRVGSFANAFRVTPDTDDECFLDFSVYSPSEGCACIVARVRVRYDLVPVILDRLGDVFHDNNSPPPNVGDGDN